MALNIVRNRKMTPEDEAFFRAFGQRMSEARKTQGVTQVQLAEMLGMSQQTIANYEGGQLRVVASMVHNLAEAIGVSVIELMGESKSQPSPKKKRGPQSKLERQIEQINKLPRSKQKFVEEMLDTVLQQTPN